MVFVRNDNGNPGRPLNFISNPVDGIKGFRRSYLKVLIAKPLQMVRHGPLACRNAICFGIQVGGYAALMGTPVIQQFRNMHDMLRLRGQTQNHIMVLAAVELRSEQLRSFQQFSVKHAEMTDVIICAQIVDCKIRLKVERNHIVNAVSVKCGFITVYIIRTFLTDCFHIFIQHRRMQHIVVVKKSDVFSVCQRKAEIGISRNAAASFMTPVKNTAFRADPLLQLGMRLQILSVLFDIGKTHLLDIIMFRIGIIRQAEFPVFVSLREYGFDCVRQKLFRRIIKRNQNADFDVP